jgi:L-fuconolactonase
VTAAPRVDAHHHLWDPATGDYPWMTEDVAPLRRRFGPEDLAPLLAQTGIDRTVLVQTRSSTAETIDFLATAEATPFIAGVIGWVDLAASGVRDAIASLRSGPGGECLVGIRHQVHDEPDPDWLRRPAVRRGIADVGAAGLPYDLLIRPREMPAAHETVRGLPHVRFVIDHIAKPPIASRALEPWASLLTELAGEPNTWCKLSGMVTEADWSAWSVPDLQPYVDQVLEDFGPARLLFGSDWPVCTLAATYEAVHGAARDLLAALSPDETDAVFGATATEVYALAAT